MSFTRSFILFLFFFLALKTTLGVTDVVYALNYFKAKISTIMKRHCCHCNGICVTFMKIDMLFYISKMLFVFRQQVILVQKYGSKSQILLRKTWIKTYIQLVGYCFVFFVMIDLLF
jgi:hypothetical protein